MIQAKTHDELNKNFLNNQNYILGKTEKKRLLSKFFLLPIFNIFIIYPVTILLSIIYSTKIFFDVYVIKGTKGYSFIKSNPNSNLFKKFYGIEKNGAENEFYKIQLK